MVLKKKTSGAAARALTGCAKDVALWGEVCITFLIVYVGS